MKLLRDPELTNKYRARLDEISKEGNCPLCDESALQLFKYWKIVNNEYPYDLIASVHHMVTPLRHVQEGDLLLEELDELRSLKEGIINSDYDIIMEPTIKGKSIPGHFHLHLIVLK